MLFARFDPLRDMDLIRKKWCSARFFGSIVTLEWLCELIELVAAGSSGWCDVVVANWPNWLSQDLPILIEDGAVGRGGYALYFSPDCPIRWRAAAQAVKIHPRVAWPSSVNGFFSTCMTGLNWYWKKICIIIQTAHCCSCLQNWIESEIIWHLEEREGSSGRKLEWQRVIELGLADPVRPIWKQKQAEAVSSSVHHVMIFVVEYESLSRWGHFLPPRPHLISQ